MSRDVYDDWNYDGNLPELAKCPFCGGKAILCDNSWEEPVIDEHGAYVDMDMGGGDTLWCECSECGAMLPGEDTPEAAIEKWNRRCEQPNPSMEKKGGGAK